jgi:hypothetical protein
MGASESKSTSINETLNNIVNEVVNESSTIIKTTATSEQLIKVKCTPEESKAATEAHARLYEAWLKYGSIGTPPEQIMCVVKDISQDSVISLKTDDQSKNELQNNIEKELENKANQITKEKIEQPILGYSDSQIEAINRIKNNILNKTYSKTLKDVINSVLVKQTIDLSGVGAVNLNQKAAVSLISSAITNSLTENIDKTALTNTNDQTKETENTSALGDVLNNFISTMGSIFNNAIDTFGSVFIIFMILALVFVYVFRCPIATFFPPVAFILCSSNDDDDDGDDGDVDNSKTKSTKKKPPSKNINSTENKLLSKNTNYTENNSSNENNPSNENNLSDENNSSNEEQDET